MGTHCLTTVTARSAARDGFDENVVALLEARYCEANIMNNTDAFVTEDATGLAGRNIPVQDLLNFSLVQGGEANK
jgi:hypothetical protein